MIISENRNHFQGTQLFFNIIQKVSLQNKLPWLKGTALLCVWKGSSTNAGWWRTGYFGGCTRVLKRNASLWIKHIIISLCEPCLCGPLQVILECYLQMYNLHQISLDPSSEGMHPMPAHLAACGSLGISKKVRKQTLQQAQGRSSQHCHFPTARKMLFPHYIRASQLPLCGHARDGAHPVPGSLGLAGALG